MPKTISRWNGFTTIAYTIPEKILAQRKRSNYLAIGLTKNHKQVTFSVHRLVAEAFIPNPDDLPCVNHKDENKYNNSVNNLEWCTHEYNNSYGTRTKRTCKQVECVETGVIYDSTVQASKYTDINRVNITNCCNNKVNTAGGFHWKYVNNSADSDS